jgi:membrane-bound ClpP family serine protease
MESLLLWGLILLAVAVVLVIIDLFVPSMGMLSLAGIAVAIAGCVVLFRYDTTWGFVGVTSCLVGGPALFALGFKIMPHTPVGKRLILNDKVLKVPQAGTKEVFNDLESLIGQAGLVVSDLRPVGIVKIDNAKYDALSETTLIRAGATVKVIAVEGSTLKVRAVGS